jgi:hypothetical protein
MCIRSNLDQAGASLTLNGDASRVHITSKPAKDMTSQQPLSPSSVSGSGDTALPAYLSNGIVGLRVRHLPLCAGMALLIGYTGQHGSRHIEAAARAPYPLAGDLCLNGVWLSDCLDKIVGCEQSYDFASGELTTSFRYEAGLIDADVRVLTFCCRRTPTLVCQSVELKLSGECDVTYTAFIDIDGVEGRALRVLKDTPGHSDPCCDGILHWESAGAISTCGIAYIAAFESPIRADRKRSEDQGRLATSYSFHAMEGSIHVVQQMSVLIPSAMHGQPDLQAGRLAALAKSRGFAAARSENREEWAELWKGRVRLVGAPRRWQELADAAFFYLNSSVHSSSPASTSIFGLATWKDYHYYYGCVMWDIERFSTPVLSLLQPGAAAAILDYRSRNITAAQQNAHLLGRRGLQFPWMSAASSGQEVSPLPGEGAWQEDHISLDVALAFEFHAAVSGDGDFLLDKAWPILSGVSDWLVSRVAETPRGYEIQHSMGIAETKTPVNNPAFTNMSAKMVLEATIRAAVRLGRDQQPAWRRIADRLVLPIRGDVVVSHDDYRIDEEKGATPEPAMGIFPVWYGLDGHVLLATLDFYLNIADQYNGSPMLSALYGVWAAWTGKRELAARLLNDGYGAMVTGRFLQTLEYHPERFPEQPLAAPLMANLSGFLLGLILGFPGICPGSDDPGGWGRRPVVLPEGWEAIEIDRIWVHGRPARLFARHGADSAKIEFH